MRLAYVDEAGISNPTQEPFLVVAGVVVHGDGQMAQVRSQLNKAVRNWIPPDQQESFVFHATELFNGGGKVFVRDPKDTPNPKWPLEKRLEIAKDIAKIFKANRLPIAFAAIDRATFPLTELARSGWDQLTAKQKIINTHVTAHVVATMKVDVWLRQNAPNEHAMMIVEDNQQAKKLIHSTQQYYQQRKLETLLSDHERKYFPLRKIVEDPLFQEKRPGSVLQLADFAAYVIKRRLMGASPCDDSFDLIQSQIVDPVVTRAPKRRA